MSSVQDKAKSSDSESNLVLAMVALSKAELPELSEFQEAAKQFPEILELTNLNCADDIISFNTTYGFGAIALVIAPIAPSDLEGACAMSWQWPDADKVLQPHRQHLIVTISGKTDDKIVVTLELTALIATLIKVVEVIGVYWGNAGVVHSPVIFGVQAQKMSREFLPLYLWVNFSGTNNGDGTHTLTTTGMKAFGLMEIEALNSSRSAKELLDRVFNVCHYLLDHGPVLKDGDTIGMSATEKIRVQHKPSNWVENRLVYRLTV